MQVKERPVNVELKELWERLAEHYYVPDVYGRRIVEQYMNMLKPQSLIEVGCGSGELFTCFKDIPRVMAVDWQDIMLKRSAARIQRHCFQNIQLAKADITQTRDVLEIRAQFDVALTRTVLMHIAPEDIEVACRNMTLLSDKILAFEFYNPEHGLLSNHNWHHEYPSLFREFGYKVESIHDRTDGQPQILFIFSKIKVT